MKLLLKNVPIILYLYFVSAFEFSEIINSNGHCEDSKSITINATINFLKIYGCDHIFPFNPALHTYKIKHLNLRGNAIPNLTEEYFKELITVENLEIIKNNVSQMEENVFESLQRLVHLKIIEPHLRLQDLILSNDCELESLHLELQSFDPQLLSTLPEELRKVTIANTPAPALSNEFSIPNNFMNLKYLKLRNCSIAIWNQSEAIFSALEYLDLSHNEIKEIPFLSENYPNLLALILSYNRISSIGEKAFESLKSLEILQLDNNKIHFLHLNAFSNSMNLAAVDLSCNSLAQISLYYKDFHRYRLDERLSCMVEPSYFNKDIIECIDASSSIIIIISLVLSSILVFVIFMLWNKWKGLAAKMSGLTLKKEAII